MQRNSSKVSKVQGPHGAGIHPQGAAQTAGDALEKFHATESGTSGFVSDVLESGSSAGGDPLAFQFDAREVRVGQRKYNSPDTSVADQQVGATTQEKQRDAAQMGNFQRAR